MVSNGLRAIGGDLGCHDKITKGCLLPVSTRPKVALVPSKMTQMAGLTESLATKLEASKKLCILGCDVIHCSQEDVVMYEPGLFALTDHLERLSATGDPLEALDRRVDFEVFRPVLTRH